MRPTRTRTRLLNSFAIQAIQVEHEPESKKPSTDCEAACLCLAVRDTIVHFGIMGQVESKLLKSRVHVRVRVRRVRVCALYNRTLTQLSKIMQSPTDYSLFVLIK